MELTVERVDRHPVEVPFREVPRRNMDRELPHWRYFEVYEVELGDGSVGHGESMCFYTWGRTGPEEVERARGGNAADLMWDDSLGAGLQIALFDAVGRALEVPVHALLGDQVNERVPVSWWCIDMSAEDWVAECEAAIERGYTDVKLKGRPWWDLRETVGAISDATPESFGIDIDFNRTALDAERAIPLLRDLEAYPQLRAFEEPIDREDPGNHDIMDAVDAELAHHYSYEEPIEALADARADGYIFTGGADELRDDAATVAAAGKPFWLQMVGTGVTAVFSAHVGAVCERAEWPAINCHQLYEHDLLAEPLDVADGTAAVPEGPGLGRRVDMDAVERFRAEIPDEKPPVDVLIETDWPDGPTLYTTTGKQLTSAARADELPYFARGVETRVIEDDGSDWYQETFERARADGPVEA